MKRMRIIRALVTGCFILMAVITVYSQTHPYTIVGTGVTKCYGNNAEITCPTNPSDSFYGQNQGITPSYQDNGNGTITDLNTGLMWIKARGSKTTWDSTFLKASQCSTGGYNDWRIPTIKELYSLINFNGKSGPTAAQCIPYIDTNYFGWTTGNTAIGERVIDAQDWSATKYKGLTMLADSTVFGVNFVDGRIKGYPQYQPGTGNAVKYKLYIRFVRGNTNYGINNFHDNGDGTITDNATGLMWMTDDSGSGMNWKAALAYAQNSNTQNYLGYNDWRLPHAKELHSIVDYARCKDYTNSSAIDPVFSCTQLSDEGGNINWPFYWTNTTHLDNMGGVYVAFGEALGWMNMPPTATYYTLEDVHGAGAQRSDPKNGSPTDYFLGYDQQGHPVYGRGPQGDVIRINNFVRLVRDASTTAVNENNNDQGLNIYPNPASDLCTISLGRVYSTVHISIFNALGLKVRDLRFTNTNAADLDLTGLTSGILSVNVAFDGALVKLKIIKL